MKKIIPFHWHRAPVPEEEPLPGEEPTPQEEPVPHPDPVLRRRLNCGSVCDSVQRISVPHFIVERS